jgi:hypothetical protein
MIIFLRNKGRCWPDYLQQSFTEASGELAARHQGITVKIISGQIKSSELGWN